VSAGSLPALTGFHSFRASSRTAWTTPVLNRRRVSTDYKAAPVGKFF